MNYLPKGDEVRTSNGSLSRLLMLKKTGIRVVTFYLEDCRYRGIGVLL